VNAVDVNGLLKYNTDDTERTGRISGEILIFAECMEKCVGVELKITGGSEKKGHSRGSKHYSGEVCDFGIASNKDADLSDENVNKCFNECKKDNYWGQYESKNPHWHFQVVPSPKGAVGITRWRGV
jgi:hypothetical protein